VRRAFFQVEIMAALSRRTVLAFMAAAGALAAAGGLASGPETLIRKILSRRFPDVRMNQASIAALTRDLMQARFQSFGRRTAVEGLARAVSVLGVDALANWKATAEPFQHLERQVVTYFVLGSDFLDVKDAKRDIVTYTATPEVCPNRFAEYDS
jgi:hypothetical protein